MGYNLSDSIVIRDSHSVTPTQSLSSLNKPDKIVGKEEIKVEASEVGGESETDGEPERAKPLTNPKLSERKRMQYAVFDAWFDFLVNVMVC
jgi:hypothetical protein